MNRAIEIWNSSILGRVLTAICLWFSGQWQRSRVVRAFVAPMAGRQAAESSVFFRLWDLIRGGLCALYRRLGLERLFGGSIFLRLTLWCSAAVVLAPLLPTMAVLALAAGGLRLPGTESGPGTGTAPGLLPGQPVYPAVRGGVSGGHGHLRHAPGRACSPAC